MSMKRLKELTDRLPPLVDLIATRAESVEYEVSQGTVHGFGLWKDTQLAVQRAYLSKGAAFPRHSHEAYEYLIVYRGRLRVKLNGDEQIVKTGEAAILQPGQAHSVEALEETWILAVTVPAVEGYPDAS